MEPQPVGPAPSPIAGGFPPDWQDLLFRALDLQSGDEVRPEFLEALHFFNHAWVPSGSGDGRSPNHTQAPTTVPDIDYASPRADLRAYALFYMTINLPKLWAVLRRTPPLPTGDAAWGITEVGCGPGTFLWAHLLWLERHAPADLARLTQVTGIDRCGPALTIARRIAAEFQARPAFGHLTFAFREADWRHELRRPADVLLFGNVLTEQTSDSAAWTADAAARAIVIVEPGTARSFHRLLPVRDALVHAGWTVQFPCVRADVPCPMKPEDWCHFCVNRFHLPYIQRMANRAGRLNPRHNFSAFVFTPSAAAPITPADASPGQDWRVLSNLRKSNRSGIRWLCNGARLREVVLGRRERTADNRVFLDADWGDRLCVRPGPARNDPGRSGRIAQDDRVALAGADEP